MLLGQFINDSINLLKFADCDAPRTDTLAILEHVLGKDKSWILTHTEFELSDKNIVKLNKLVQRRKNHEPLAYIIGYKEFYGRNFKVTPDVLIPRPESEDIIDLAKKINCQNFIDIGTGSGCLAISLSLELDTSNILALDISKNALKIAEINSNNLGAKIKFIESDLIKNLSHADLAESCLVVNLPYVPRNLITSPEIKNEPKLPLFSGNDGMDWYHKFWDQIKILPKKPIYIITECLIDQQKEMTKLAKKASFEQIECLRLIQVFKAN